MCLYRPMARFGDRTTPVPRITGVSRIRVRVRVRVRVRA